MALYGGALKPDGGGFVVGFPAKPALKYLADGILCVGVTLFGGYASRIVVPDHQVFPKPTGWSAEEAAGLPAVFLTAWYALVRCAAVEAAKTTRIIDGAKLSAARGRIVEA